MATLMQVLSILEIVEGVIHRYACNNCVTRLLQPCYNYIGGSICCIIISCALYILIFVQGHGTFYTHVIWFNGFVSSLQEMASNHPLVLSVEVRLHALLRFLHGLMFLGQTCIASLSSQEMILVSVHHITTLVLSFVCKLLNITILPYIII